MAGSRRNGCARFNPVTAQPGGVAVLLAMAISAGCSGNASSKGGGDGAGGGNGSPDGGRSPDVPPDAAEPADGPVTDRPPPSSTTVTLAPISAFEPSRQRVTTLAGWPTNRKPIEVITQGKLVKATVRRSWKNTDNDGTFIDFYPGWQNTGAGNDTILVRLDDGSTVDLSYQVRDPIPAPTGSGVRRYLDASRGVNGDGSASNPWNTWSAAIAGLTAGDVLVVAAKPGKTVYTVDGDTGGPVASVSNATVMADPADIAAGRRPTIHANGSLFAPYWAAAKPNGLWELYKHLGGSHGTVWRTKRTFPAPEHTYSAMYKAKSGRWIKLYSLRHIDATGERTTTRSGMTIMTDTAYARYTRPNSITYLGPSISYEEDGYYYIRLTPPVKQTIFNPATTGSIPWPHWDWTEDYAPNQDPNNVDIAIVSGNQYSTANYLLKIDGHDGWVFKNLDFISGNTALSMIDSDNIKFFGCTWKGGASPQFNIEGGLSYVWEYIRADAAAARSAGLLFDHSEVWGGTPPWQSWHEGKGGETPGAVQYRGSFLSGHNIKVTLRHSLVDGFWCWYWSQGPFLKLHFHHSIIREYGHDGAIAGIPRGDYAVNRSLMLNAGMYGFSSDQYPPRPEDRNQIGLTLMVNVATLATSYGGNPNQNKWANVNNGTDVPVLPATKVVFHGGYKLFDEWMYNNTGIGTNHHHRTGASGGGSQIGPAAWAEGGGPGHRVFNSIGTIVPGPWKWTAGQGNHAVRYYQQSGAQYDHNLLWRQPNGWPTSGDGAQCDGLILRHTSKSTFDCFADSAAGFEDFKAATGYETNGLRADPQFVWTPRWASTSPYSTGHYNPASYMLKAESPGRTGGKDLSSFNFID